MQQKQRSKRMLETLLQRKRAELEQLREERLALEGSFHRERRRHQQQQQDEPLAHAKLQCIYALEMIHRAMKLAGQGDHPQHMECMEELLGAVCEEDTSDIEAFSRRMLEAEEAAMSVYLCLVGLRDPEQSLEKLVSDQMSRRGVSPRHSSGRN